MVEQVLYLAGSVAQQFGDSGRPLKIDTLINTVSGLTLKEREFIFSYLKEGVGENAKKDENFITNVIIIIDMFFQYGLRVRGNATYTSGSGSYTQSQSVSSSRHSSTVDLYGEECFGSKYWGKIDHYWDFVSQELSHLDTVKFINFDFDEAPTNKEKAFGWILLALNTENDLWEAFVNLFAKIDVVYLYRQKDSFFVENRGEILKALESFKGKNFYQKCPLIDRFSKQMSKKKQQQLKSQHQKPSVTPKPLDIVETGATGGGLSGRIGEHLNTQSSGGTGGNMYLNLIEKFKEGDSVAAKLAQQMREQAEPAQRGLPSPQHREAPLGVGRLNLMGSNEIMNSSQNLNSANEVSRDSISDAKYVERSATGESPQRNMRGQFSAKRMGTRHRDNSSDLNHNLSINQDSSQNNISGFSHRGHNKFSRAKKSKKGRHGGIQSISGAQSGHSFSSGGLKHRGGNTSRGSSDDEDEMQYMGLVSPTRGNPEEEGDDSRLLQRRKGSNDFSASRSIIEKLVGNTTGGPGTNTIMNKSLNSSGMRLHANPFENSMDYRAPDMGTHAVDSFDRHVIRETREENHKQGTPGQDNTVPLGQRDQFRMRVYTKQGLEVDKKLTNSNLVMLNEFLYTLRDNEYTSECQGRFMEQKWKRQQQESYGMNQCSTCKVTVQSRRKWYDSLVPWQINETTNSEDELKFCHFCMDRETCRHCMAEELIFIPKDLQLEVRPTKKAVCAEAFDFLCKFQFVRVDKRNPILEFKPALRRALVLRRKVHKMFDQLKCEEWHSLLERSGFRNCKFLVLQDCHLTFDLICEPTLLENILKKMFTFLEEHLVTCISCYYKGEKCKICHDGSNLFKNYEVDTVGRCPFCEKLAHRDCITRQHDCTFVPPVETAPAVSASEGTSQPSINRHVPSNLSEIH